MAHAPSLSVYALGIWILLPLHAVGAVRGSQTRRRCLATLENSLLCLPHAKTRAMLGANCLSARSSPHQPRRHLPPRCPLQLPPLPPRLLHHPLSHSPLPPLSSPPSHHCPPLLVVSLQRHPLPPPPCPSFSHTLVAATAGVGL